MIRLLVLIEDLFSVLFVYCAFDLISHALRKKQGANEKNTQKETHTSTWEMGDNQEKKLKEPRV
jgi:hypothetical protein